MNKLVFILVISVLFNPCLAQDTNKTHISTVSLVISGTIKNFKEFKTHVVSKTYIQLVPLPADGTIWISNTFKDGKLSYVFFESELKKLLVPKKAAFSFNLVNIPPGKFFLAAQRTNLKWATDWQAKASDGPMFLTNEGAMFIIDVPVGTKSPYKIKAGDLIIRIK
jgi:hypothetical protein